MAGSLVVAVVDDEASVRKALARLLAASDLEAETFASGQEFLHWLAGHHVDCLVLDLHMPGLNGLEVQRQLARAGVRLPIVIITAYDDPEWREKCLAEGAAAYLLKPLDGTVFLNGIAQAVANAPRGPPGAPEDNSGAT